MGQKQRAASGTISTTGACQLLMLSRQRLDQLVQEGWIQRHIPGQWIAIDLVQGYIRFMRDESRRTSKSAAGSRVQDARAREIELRTARDEGRIVDMEDVEAVVADVLGTYHSELFGVPTACTRDLELRATIEKNLNGAIDRCRDRFEKAQRDLRSGGEVGLDGEEATA